MAPANPRNTTPAAANPRERERTAIMPTRNYKKILGDWQVLHDNLTPRLTDMPQVTGDHSTLATVLGEARDLQNQQEAATAALRNLNQKRREILSRGGDVSSRLSLALRSVLGT